jgi:hypothetical protein
MTRFLAILFILLAVILAAALAGSCGSSSSSGDDDATAADDDDNDDASPGDDDDDASPADDDATPTGPAPLIDTLILTPNSGYAGTTIGLSFHWQSLAGDVNGGTVDLYINGASVKTFTATTSKGNSGYIDLAYQFAANVAAGPLTVGVTLTDLAGYKSNMITAIFTSRGVDSPPVISNLRFSPSPACNAANATFDVIFDYSDPPDNLDGGVVEIMVDNQLPPAQFTLSGSGSTSGTLQIPLAFTSAVPDNTSVPFQVGLEDNQGLASNLLTGNLLFTAAACGN